jgi:hypothetical protein
MGNEVGIVRSRSLLHAAAVGPPIYNLLGAVPYCQAAFLLIYQESFSVKPVIGVGIV